MRAVLFRLALKALGAIAVMLVLASSSVVALTPEQRTLYESGINYYDIEEGELGSGAGCALAGSNNPEKTWNFLVDKGLTAVQAAGAMGNLQHEGGFNPSRVEDGAARGGSWIYTEDDYPEELDYIPPIDGPQGQPGYGIVQWTSANRKEGLQEFSDNDPQERPVNDLHLQLEYMWQELESDDYKSRVLEPIMASDDLGEVVSIWQDKYEVGTNFPPRFEAAKDWLTQFGSGTGGGTGCGDATGDWGWPLEPVGRITGCFGPRSSPGGIGSTNHKGLDIASGGAEILAADGGEVVHAGPGASGVGGGFGRFVVVDHGGGVTTRYGHAASLSVQPGDQVSKGDKLGIEGTTGASTGVHLHFEILYDGSQIDPLDELSIPTEVGNATRC